ncbi:MAG: hypothetical protein WAL56_02305 [Candidatus Sulfotelmatobacter sp.]
MKIKLDRIISIATLIAAVVAIVLVLKKPATVVQPQTANSAPVSAQPLSGQSVNQKSEQSEPAPIQTQQAQPSQPSLGLAAPQPAQNLLSAPSPQAATHSSSDGIGSAISQILSASAGGAAALTPDSDVGSGAPNIKDQKVDYDGDTVHGHFLTEIAGKDVWVTISGHMGQKDGYATFEPTEFKVGDMDVPVSLVNPALQRKLAEERDRLKLSDPTAAK